MLFFILVLDTSAVGQLNVFYPEKALFENNWLENFEKLKANFVISLAFLIVLIHQSTSCEIFTATLIQTHVTRSANDSPSSLTSKTWLIILPSSCWKFPCKLAMLDQDNNLYLFAGTWMDIIGRGYMLVTSGN